MNRRVDNLPLVSALARSVLRGDRRRGRLCTLGSVTLMAELWRIELLGGLRVVHPDRIVNRFRTQKAGALLSYLAFYAHRAHSREQLIETFWPEKDLDSARDRLRVALSSLRRQLEPPGIPAGAVILASRHSVQLNPAAIDTDVARFEAALRSANGSASPSDEIERLATAVELYCGPLLPQHFEAWVLPEQQRLEGLFFHAAGRLARLLEQSGELGKALDVAGRAVAAGPLREEVQREFIRLLARVGQPTAALDQYRRMEQLLREELDEAPSAATRHLVTAIERQAAPGPAAEPFPPGNGRAAIPDLPHHPDPRSAAPFPSPPAGTVTFLLTRIEDTLTATAQPPESSNAARKRWASTLCEVFRCHDGYPVQERDDRVLAAFAGAGPALAAAVAARRRLMGEGSSETERLLLVSMALHTGEIVWAGGVYRGPALQQIEVVLTRAVAGQILCSELTARLLQNGPPAIQSPGVELVDLHSCPSPAPATPERLFQVREAAPSAPPPPVEPDGGLTERLPLHSTRFIGREAELVQLAGLLRSPGARLVTLTGPGGSGKTRLAIEAARRLLTEGGRALWWVPLADITDPRLIAEAIRGAMRLPRAPETPVLDQVTQALSQARDPRLLLFDNFEHLVESSGLVRQLLERVPGLRCLVTSRQLLRLPGEREFRVDPLPAPPESHDLQELARCDSVRLFVDRAQAVRPSFEVGERNAAAVGALCRQLEGIPLAIELAAAQIRLLSPEQMRRRLAHRFEFLASRRRDLLPRHRTLRAAIDASYHLLVPDLQRLFARLSVFRGGWTLEAAAAICSDGGEAAGFEGGGREPLDHPGYPAGTARDIETALAELQARSLLQTRGEDPRERGFMLETLREYAAEQLAPEERAALAERHARFYLAMAEEAEPHLGLTPLQDMWLRRLEWDHDNLRAAVAWCLDTGNTEVGLRLGGALRRFWWWHEHLEEGRRLLERLLALPGAEDRATGRARALLAAGQLAATQGDTGVAACYLEEARAIHLELGESRWATDALRGLAGLAAIHGDYARARALYEEDLALVRELGDKGAIAGALGNLGNVAEYQGDFAAARRLHAEGDALRREIGLPIPGRDHVSISVR